MLSPSNPYLCECMRSDRRYTDTERRQLLATFALTEHRVQRMRLATHIAAEATRAWRTDVVTKKRRDIAYNSRTLAHMWAEDLHTHTHRRERIRICPIWRWRFGVGVLALRSCSAKWRQLFRRTAQVNHPLSHQHKHEMNYARITRTHTCVACARVWILFAYMNITTVLFCCWAEWTVPIHISHMIR